MKTVIAICFLMSVFVYSTNGQSNNCLACICEVEGCQGQLNKCRFDVNGDACGPYQIHSPYFTDCHRSGMVSDWRTCTKQTACSETCVRNYMNRYAARCTSPRTPTCQDYARVHNGGPRGCSSSATVGYWNKVSACCNRRGGC